MHSSQCYVTSQIFLTTKVTIQYLYQCLFTVRLHESSGLTTNVTITFLYQCLLHSIKVTGHTVLTTNVTIPFLYQCLLYSITSRVILS